MEKKIYFLKNDFVPHVKRLTGEQKPLWGIMTPQHMIEHLVAGVRISNAKATLPLHTPADKLPAYREFLMSDKEFKPNTKNPILPDVLMPLRRLDLEDAIRKLEEEMRDFFIYFDQHPSAILVHPIFGELDYRGWIQMHHKHFIHHLKQFQLL